MYVNIIVYSNQLILFVWSTLKKEKKKKQNTEAVVCVTIVKEKKTIVKNRIAQIKLEFTFANFFEEFVGQNKLKNEVSGDVKIEIREAIEGTPFQTFKLKALVLFALSSNKRKMFS